MRYHFTGRYDGDDDNNNILIDNAVTKAGISLLKRYIQTSNSKRDHNSGSSNPEMFGLYLWMYVLFTYFFTMIAINMLMRQTKVVVNTRQNYLGKQNTVTDRTIRLSGIPIELRDVNALKTESRS